MDSDFGIMRLKACFSEMIVFGLEEMIFEVGTKVYSNNYHKAVNGVLAEKKESLATCAHAMANFGKPVFCCIHALHNLFLHILPVFYKWERSCLYDFILVRQYTLE